MKKVILMATIVAIVSAAGFMPFDGTDIAELHPVEVLIVSRNGNDLILETDSGMHGTGKGVQEALLDLKNSTSGNIFLDTVNYLLVAPDCVDKIASLWDYIRPACQVYSFKGEGEYSKIGKYLKTHPSEATVLRCMQKVKRISILIMEGEKFHIAR